MTTLVWSNDLATGNSTVDFQHQHMITQINKLDAILSSDGPEAEIALALKALVEFSEKHFKDEDALMNSQGYRRYPHHKSRHDFLIMSAKRALQAHKDGGTELRTEAAALLDRWVRHHTTEDDMDFRNWLKKG